MSLSFDKQTLPEQEDLTVSLQPLPAERPRAAPEHRTDSHALQTSIGNSAIASTTSNGASSSSFRSTPNLQSAFGNAAVSRIALAQVRESPSQATVANQVSPAATAKQDAANPTEASTSVADPASRREAHPEATAPSTAGEPALSQPTTAAPAPVASETGPAASTNEGAARGAKSETASGADEAANKADEAMAATDEAVATAEEAADPGSVGAPTGETAPMPSFTELLGPVEAEPAEEENAEDESVIPNPPQFAGGETPPDFSPAPSIESEPVLDSSSLVIQRKPVSDAAPEVSPMPVPDAAPVISEESPSPTNDPQATTNSAENSPEPTSSADTQGMAQLIAAAAAAEERIEAQTGAIRTTLTAGAATQSQTVQTQVVAAVATIRAAFAAERAALEVSVNAARADIATQLAARQAEAVASGEESKSALRDLYAQHRAEVAEVVQSNITAAEQMRTHYASMVHERTQAQAAEARRRGETKAATYPGDERGRLQATAARGVANQTASEIQQREPEAVQAIEETVAEIPAGFAEQSAQALVGFDDHLPELLAQIDTQVTGAGTTLIDKAAEANEQLDTLAEQLRAQIDALETASVARAEAVGPQAEAQTDNALKASLEQLDTAKPDAVSQIKQVKEEATQALLGFESVDPAAAQEFTDEVIAFINSIAELASGSLQQAGGGVESGFANVETATSESLQSVEQQVADDIATLHGESESAIRGLLDGVDMSFGETIDALEAGFTETESKIDSELKEKVDDLKSDFSETLQDAEAEIVEAVDSGLSKNDEALAQLGPAMQEAADDAAWDFDHPVLSTLRDIGMFILGALAAIIVLIVAIVVVILVFKAAVALLVIAGVAAAVAEAIVAIAGLALLAYGIYEAYQARVGRGEGGGWGTFGMALLDMTGLTTMYRAFTQPGLTPFQRGWMFGEGLVQLVLTVLLVRGAWRFVRSGGLKTAWQALWRGAGRLARGIGRGLSSLGRGISRGIRNVGRWLKGLRSGRKPPPGRRSGGGRGCFIAGTLVRTPSGGQPIESLTPGDEVVTLDVSYGEQQSHAILQVFVRNVLQVIELRIADETITCSAEHPFWVPGRGWMEAQNLTPGIEVFSIERGNVEVHSIECKEERVTVYNIEVGGLHTYCVSGIGVLVHNKAMRAGPIIKASGQGFEAIDPGTGKTVGIGSLRDGYLELAIETKGTGIRGGDVVNGIYDAFISRGSSVRGVRGLWYAQDNLASFNRAISAGLAPEAAAMETFTGKMASRLGFNRVRIDYPNSPRRPDGTFERAELWFE